MTLLITILAVAALTGTAARLVPAWETRDIRASGPWPVTLAVAAVAALAAMWVTVPVFGAAAAIAAAAAAWLSTLAVSTDLACRKIPYEIPHPVAGIGLAAGAAEFSREAAMSFVMTGVALVALPLVLRALTRKGLGMSDVRLLWAYTATLSWWVGQDWLIYGLAAAAVAQLAVRVVARPLRLGALVPRDQGIDLAYLSAEERSTVILRRELPFAPAIVVGITGAVAYALVTGAGACAMWTLSGVCG